MTGSSISAARPAAAEGAAVIPAGTTRDTLVADAVPAAKIAAAAAIGYITRAGTGSATVPQTTLLAVRYSRPLLAIARAQVPTALRAVTSGKISIALLPADVLPGIILPIGQ